MLEGSSQKKALLFFLERPTSIHVDQVQPVQRNQLLYQLDQEHLREQEGKKHHLLLAQTTSSHSHGTLKHNLAKSGALPGLSKTQHTPLSLPETIAEKEEAAEFAGIKELEESKVSTTFKLPLHVQDDVVMNNGFEVIEKYSLSGGEMDPGMEGVYLDLPVMPPSISNPSLLSIKSENDSHIICFTNPMFMEEEEEGAQF